jgi:hypothetical protein
MKPALRIELDPAANEDVYGRLSEFRGGRLPRHARSLHDRHRADRDEDGRGDLLQVILAARRFDFLTPARRKGPKPGLTPGTRLAKFRVPHLRRS